MMPAPAERVTGDDSIHPPTTAELVTMRWTRILTPVLLLVLLEAGVASGQSVLRIGQPSRVGPSQRGRP
jgi:hypothetical protein